MSLKGIAGKTAIVTGGGAGIGEALVARLLAEGARVLAVDRDSDRLAALSQADETGACATVAADVATEDGWSKIMRAAEDRFGGADLLANNAGILGATAALEELSMENWDQVMAVNARGVVLGMRAMARHLIDAGRPGAIVNTASIGAMRANPKRLAYAASKAAVIAITQGASHDLGAHGIRINAVAPGATETPMSVQVDAARMLGGSRPDIQKRPITRKANPGEIANVIAWLMSDEASYVTGAIYTVDGGMTA
ncbi:SDR family oxidoreductase [Mesorhizobium sp. CAU 1741]|uniref:SDR family NAD(P)-dependent oxidoreductase n=1 Tax=Mesorhizobium sp. CAU 1741 TaxID=3140366 RepID=UPI00325A970E